MDALNEMRKQVNSMAIQKLSVKISLLAVA
jgi:hypothetical protein